MRGVWTTTNEYSTTSHQIFKRHLVALYPTTHDPSCFGSGGCAKEATTWTGYTSSIFKSNQKPSRQPTEKEASDSWLSAPGVGCLRAWGKPIVMGDPQLDGLFLGKSQHKMDTSICFLSWRDQQDHKRSTKYICQRSIVVCKELAPCLFHLSWNEGKWGKVVWKDLLCLSNHPILAHLPRISGRGFWCCLRHHRHHHQHRRRTIHRCVVLGHFRQCHRAVVASLVVA